MSENTITVEWGMRAGDKLCGFWANGPDPVGPGIMVFDGYGRFNKSQSLVSKQTDT